MLLTVTGLIPENVLTMVSGFAEKIVPTVMQILEITVPVSLVVWGIYYAVGKGLGALKKQA